MLPKLSICKLQTSLVLVGFVRTLRVSLHSNQINQRPTEALGAFLLSLLWAFDCYPYAINGWAEKLHAKDAEEKAKMIQTLLFVSGIKHFITKLLWYSSSRCYWSLLHLCTNYSFDHLSCSVKRHSRNLGVS